MTSPGRATWRAAVSPLVAAVVASRGDGRVLGVFPTCVYLGFEDHATVVALLARDALQLPIGMCLTASSREISWGLAPGDHVRVGGGMVRLPRVDVVAAREQRPARVFAAAHRPTAHLRGGTWATALPDSVRSDLADRATEIADAALSGAPLARMLSALLGSGPGLTPAGDDAVSGVLLTLRSAGEMPAVDRLRRELEPLLPATTSLSAALLRAAAEGYAAPPVVALLDQIARGQFVAAALDPVLAIGHTSGSDLVAGIVGTTRALHPALHPALPPALQTRPKEALHA